MPAAAMIAGICGPEPAAAPDRAAAAVAGNALGCAVPRSGGRVFGFAECCLVGTKRAHTHRGSPSEATSIIHAVKGGMRRDDVVEYLAADAMSCLKAGFCASGIFVEITLRCADGPRRSGCLDLAGRVQLPQSCCPPMLSKRNIHRLRVSPLPKRPCDLVLQRFREIGHHCAVVSFHKRLHRHARH
jgi:hypothetical protein